MSDFLFQETAIPGLIHIIPFRAADHRGFLAKPFEKSIFAANGIDFSPSEELESFSKKGVVRGLHFQRSNGQDKLVRVLHGAVYDAAVDLRANSETFGTWAGFLLSAENRRMLYIPEGFAHGFLAMREGTILHYLCGGRYDPASEDGIIWNDPELKIAWPLEPGQTPVLSSRDRQFQTFAQFRQSL